MVLIVGSSLTVNLSDLILNSGLTLATRFRGSRASFELKTSEVVAGALAGEAFVGDDKQKRAHCEKRFFFTEGISEISTLGGA